MRFSLNWLGEFVDLPNDTNQLTDLLTLAGVEVEGIESRGANFDRVIVAQITASERHPNGDRLSVCQVNDGSGQNRQIVCGATNYKVGDKVPLALPGALLPNDLKIRASKLRGVESQGMLCSARELNLADDAAGLLILAPEATVGAPLSELFPNDTIFDIEITPNRADLLSHYGLAREIAAITRKVLRSPQIPQPSTVDANETRITAPNECPFYSVRRIENINVGPSPAWLRTRVESVGLRSINNIVDITNFVMLELGQPLHAFDADKLSGGIKVRLAQPHETFRALDGRTYELDPGMLMIADTKRAIAIGGVMGGEETGVTESTRNILLESAWFLPSSVRRTARQLNLPTDASYRFERGVDPAMVLRASERASRLIEEVAGGKAAQSTMVAGALPAPPPEVGLRYTRLNQLAGAEISRPEAEQILCGLGLAIVAPNDAETTWRIPSFRRDLRREVDLIEEVVRIWGIDRIPASDRSRFTPSSVADRRYDLGMQVRRRLLARGFSEVRTSALVSRESLGGSLAAGALELRNPLSEDHVALRPSLAPGLLCALERNLRAGEKSIQLFELGAVFLPPRGTEIQRLGLALFGESRRALHWRNARARPLDLFDLKGAVEALNLGMLSWRRADGQGFALRLEIVRDSKVIGYAGQLSASEAIDGRPTLLAEIDLPNEAISGSHPRFHPLQRYPSIQRDIAMFVPENVSHGNIMDAIQKMNEPLLVSVELFDLFEDPTAPQRASARKSLAYSLTYQDKNRTLTTDEVSAAHNRIRERLERELGAELRE